METRGVQVLALADQAFAEIKGKKEKVPIVLVINEIDDQIIEKALHQGATEVLDSNGAMDNLLQRIRYAIARYSMTWKKERSFLQDKLTGLPNSTVFVFFIPPLPVPFSPLFIYLLLHFHCLFLNFSLAICTTFLLPFYMFADLSAFL